jgi:hypothetical protein
MKKRKISNAGPEEQVVDAEKPSGRTEQAQDPEQQLAEAEEPFSCAEHDENSSQNDPTTIRERLGINRPLPSLESSTYAFRALGKVRPQEEPCSLALAAGTSSKASVMREVRQLHAKARKLIDRRRSGDVDKGILATQQAGFFEAPKRLHKRTAPLYGEPSWVPGQAYMQPRNLYEAYRNVPHLLPATKRIISHLGVWKKNMVHCKPVDDRISFNSAVAILKNSKKP